MSLQFISQFQARIYGLLSQIQEIRQRVSGIYLSVQQDAKYPFILINIQKAQNLSKHRTYIYEVDFEICIFARDKTQEFLMQMASNIISALKPELLQSDTYNVISMKGSEAEFVRGHDLLTNKVIITYKALLHSQSI